LATSRFIKHSLQRHLAFYYNHIFSQEEEKHLNKGEKEELHLTLVPTYVDLSNYHSVRMSN
jgi:hypothetical protein